MKNQYFGDNRDLFKYDLIIEIHTKGEFIRHFTFIPMLTEDDDTKHGGKTNRNGANEGTKNIELKNFLNKCVKENRRNIKQLERFFKNRAIEITIYKKDENEYFSHVKREKYFQEIRDELLLKSLIFVDPDNGLEVTRSNKKHILYSEVKDVYDRMDENSTLMIYQHFPRNEHKEYLKRRSDELKDKTKDLPIYISDNQIIFFFLTKNKVLKESLGKIISNYGESYNSSHYNSG